MKLHEEKYLKCTRCGRKNHNLNYVNYVCGHEGCEGKLALHEESQLGEGRKLLLEENNA